MDWTAALAQADAAVAAVMDVQSFTAIGMKRPPRQANADLVVDADRPAFNFKGSIDLDPELNAVGGSNQPNASTRNARHVSRVCLTALTTGWPWTLQQGDRIESDQGLFSLVANPDSDGTARVALWLNKVK